jgi:hypothetical protein
MDGEWFDYCRARLLDTILLFLLYHFKKHTLVLASAEVFFFLKPTFVLARARSVYQKHTTYTGSTTSYYNYLLFNTKLTCKVVLEEHEQLLPTASPPQGSTLQHTFT